tara:strand:- start:349 stop:795 length:447 start_codon:yes stop_codon:yes gene_type:complete
MTLEMAMPTHYDKPLGVTEPSVRSTTTGEARGTEVSRVGSRPVDRPPGLGITPELNRKVQERYKEFDRKRFKGIYDNNRVEMVAAGRGYDADTKRMVHGGLDTLKQSDPGDWQLVQDDADTVTYMEMESGQQVKMNKTDGEYDYNLGY